MVEMSEPGANGSNIDHLRLEQIEEKLGGNGNGLKGIENSLKNNLKEIENNIRNDLKNDLKEIENNLKNELTTQMQFLMNEIKMLKK